MVSKLDIIGGLLVLSFVGCNMSKQQRELDVSNALPPGSTDIEMLTPVGNCFEWYSFKMGDKKYLYSPREGYGGPMIVPVD